MDRLWKAVSTSLRIRPCLNPLLSELGCASR